MNISSDAAKPVPVSTLDDLLSRRLAFKTDDSGRARDYLARAFPTHSLNIERSHARLQFEHRGADLGAASFHRLQYGSRVTVNVPPLERCYLLHLTLAGACEISQERKSIVVAPGQLVVMNPTMSFRKVWLVDSNQLILRVDRAFLERHFMLDADLGAPTSIDFEFVSVDAAQHAPSLTRFIHMICSELNADETQLRNPCVKRQIVGGLAALLLNSLPHSGSRLLQSADSGAAPFFVRRAKQFIAQHAREPLDLAALVRASGVSARALHQGFRRFCRTTPMAYLRDVRLDNARRELAVSCRRETKVTDVATECGFMHLGRFAKAYRARFGETPSQTIRRTSIDDRDGN
ncbi:MAG: AraC family transcriptional regulator [Alphaproteobacteria bacterium]